MIENDKFLASICFLVLYIIDVVVLSPIWGLIPALVITAVVYVVFAILVLFIYIYYTYIAD